MEFSGNIILLKYLFMYGVKNDAIENKQLLGNLCHQASVVDFLEGNLAVADFLEGYLAINLIKLICWKKQTIGDIQCEP